MLQPNLRPLRLQRRDRRKQTSHVEAGYCISTTHLQGLVKTFTFFMSLSCRDHGPRGWKKTPDPVTDLQSDGQTDVGFHGISRKSFLWSRETKIAFFFEKVMN